MIAHPPAMPFFPVLCRVCSDPDGFAPLLRGSLWRAIGHYLLLGIFGIAANLALRAAPLRARLVRATAVFETRFGEVVVDGATMLPAIAPETARGTSLGAMRVDYFPDPDAAAAFNPGSLSATAGLLWTPTALLLWQRLDERRCSVLPFPVGLFFPELATRPWLPTMVDAAEVPAHLAQGTISPAAGHRPADAAGPVRRRPHDLLPFIWGMLMMMVGLESALKVFFVAPAYILMFCLVMHLFRPRGVPGPDLPGFLKLGFYAAFPALIIAMLCSALELPGLEFHLVFSVAFLLWLFIVYGRLRRLTEKPNADLEDFA
jgi:hypothetical protein